DRVELVGTEVFRRAANVAVFRAGLPRGLALRVLRPEEEAAGSFLAACWGFRRTLPAEGNLILVDLGGGSTEVVAGVQGPAPRRRTWKACAATCWPRCTGGHGAAKCLTTWGSRTPRATCSAWPSCCPC